MNSPIVKVLASAACIMVIVASGVVILRNVTPPTQPPQQGGGEGGGQVIDPKQPQKPADPEIISTSPPQVPLKGLTVIPPNHPLQPSYKPVNQPAYLQLLRQEGKTYHNKVVGKVGGRASKKDWGVRGVAYFEYLYAVESRGKILRNDGAKIVEERAFDKVHENLLVSGYEIGIELPDKLDTVFQMLNYFGGKVATVAAAGRTAARIVNNVRIPVSREWVDQAREKGLFSKGPATRPAADGK